MVVLRFVFKCDVAVKIITSQMNLSSAPQFRGANAANLGAQSILAKRLFTNPPNSKLSPPDLQSSQKLVHAAARGEKILITWEQAVRSHCNLRGSFLWRFISKLRGATIKMLSQGAREPLGPVEAEIIGH